MTLAPINEEFAGKAEVETQVNEWIEKIKSGEVTPPQSVEEAKAFTAE